MLFMYSAVLMLVYRRWTLACVLYSFALSVKMNILLFFPGFGLILWKVLGAQLTITRLLLILIIQALLAAPFLQAYPQSYISRAFEFSRVFQYKWTVNWKFVDPEFFVSSGFAKSLLTMHITLLIAFLFGRWCRSEDGVFKVFIHAFTLTKNEIDSLSRKVTSDHILTLLFTSNFIGIAFARSLHYQFYSWYFHTLPYLIWHCNLAGAWGSKESTKIVHSQNTWPITILIRCILLGLIEYCWNVYPATAQSSMLLLACHIVILIELWFGDSEGRGPAYSYAVAKIKRG